MILEVFLYVYCLLYLVPPEFFVCSAQTFSCGYYIWSDGLYLSETSGSWETNLFIFQGLFLLALPPLYLFILFFCQKHWWSTKNKTKMGICGPKASLSKWKVREEWSRGKQCGPIRSEANQWWAPSFLEAVKHGRPSLAPELRPGVCHSSRVELAQELMDWPAHSCFMQREKGRKCSPNVITVTPAGQVVLVLLSYSDNKDEHWICWVTHSLTTIKRTLL